MMWLAVTAVMMVSFSTLSRKKSKTATRWMTLAGTGGETPAGVSFFLTCRRLTSLAGISICQEVSAFFFENAASSNIRSDSRIQRAGVGRPGPNFRPVYPICKFFATSSDLSYAFIFPVKWPPTGGRPVRICPIYLYKTGRLIIILFHYNYNIFFI